MSLLLKSAGGGSRARKAQRKAMLASHNRSQMLDRLGDSAYYALERERAAKAGGGSYSQGRLDYLKKSRNELAAESQKHRVRTGKSGGGFSGLDQKAKEINRRKKKKERRQEEVSAAVRSAAERRASETARLKSKPTHAPNTSRKNPPSLADRVKGRTLEEVMNDAPKPPHTQWRETFQKAGINVRPEEKAHTHSQDSTAKTPKKQGWSTKKKLGAGALALAGTAAAAYGAKKLYDKYNKDGQEKKASLMLKEALTAKQYVVGAGALTLAGTAAAAYGGKKLYDNHLEAQRRGAGNKAETRKPILSVRKKK